MSLKIEKPKANSVGVRSKIDAVGGEWSRRLPCPRDPWRSLAESLEGGGERVRGRARAGEIPDGEPAREGSWSRDRGIRMAGVRTGGKIGCESTGEKICWMRTGEKTGWVEGNCP